MGTQIIPATNIMEKMVARLPDDQRSAFDAGVRLGFVVLNPNQPELQRVWTLWCMQQQLPDVRVEDSGDFTTVTMHLGPSRSMLSGDGMVAVRRAFERYGEKVLHFETRTWCKHPRVSARTSIALAQHLIDIAYLDGVGVQ